MIASYPNRRFQLWEYKVSHGSLLIRSPKGPEEAINVDLVFAGVEFIRTPRHMTGLELSEDADLASTVPAGVVGRSDRVFVLASGGQHYVVVAAAVKVVEHQGDIFDPTPE